MSASYNPTGDRIVTADRDGIVKVWGTDKEGESLLEIGKKADGPEESVAIKVTSATYNPTGDRIIAAHMDGTATVWDALTGQEVLRLPAYTQSALRFAAFRP